MSRYSHLRSTRAVCVIKGFTNDTENLHGGAAADLDGDQAFTPFLLGIFVSGGHSLTGVGGLDQLSYFHRSMVKGIPKAPEEFGYGSHPLYPFSYCLTGVLINL